MVALHTYPFSSGRGGVNCITVKEPFTQYYDDPEFSYPDFWHGRDYEHGAELLALRALLGTRKFLSAVDIGGGFGRLVPFLFRHAQEVVLVEPSEIQRELAKQITSNRLTIKDGSASNTGLPDAYCDLAVMVRVMHHLPQPKESIAEVRRILKPGGYLVLEFANSLHAKSRLKRAVRFERVPLTPVRVNDSGDVSVPFVNHHPRTVYNALTHHGFVIERMLSVSNIRSPLLKKFLSPSLLALLERIMQRPLARIHFGPSIFVLARRL